MFHAGQRLKQKGIARLFMGLFGLESRLKLVILGKGLFRDVASFVQTP